MAVVTSNSGNGGGTYVASCTADIREISNWRIVDFNSTRGKIRVRMRITRFLRPIREHLHNSLFRVLTYAYTCLSTDKKKRINYYVFIIT